MGEEISSNADEEEDVTDEEQGHQAQAGRRARKARGLYRALSSFGPRSTIGVIQALKHGVHRPCPLPAFEARLLA